ncbi:chain-length determining protein [Arthrobacter sp. NPDC080031]|uniref:chain-length determining protein n=1 Tax=Arthrobacter sp. NPDC080031 TaxID=3155918 RepID=UPI00344E09B2
MNPKEVIRTLWRHRLVSVPILLLTLASALYVFQFAPRSYETSATYAMINPDIPTQLDIVKHPELEKLNSKNPYLRSSDPSLIVQVLLTRLNDSSVADKLKEQGLSSDYTVNRGVGGTNGFLVDITGIADTPEKSFATTRTLGVMLEKDLYDAQKIDGADDSYLFSSILVAPPDKATEQFSSRLRSLIAVLLAGVVLMFGAVSIARSVSVSRNRLKENSGHGPVTETRKRNRNKARFTVDSPDTRQPSGANAGLGPSAEPVRARATDSDDGQRLSELAR